MSTSRELQNFYNDRRKRGLSDKIIFNELEAAGWPVAGLEQRVLEARSVYERQPTADFMSDGSVVEYDVPRMPKTKHFNRVATLFIGAIFYAFFAWQETHDWVVVVIAVPFFGFLAFLKWDKGIFLRNVSSPRRIRFDSKGMTILQPPSPLRAWSAFVGFRGGQQQLEEGEQTHPGTIMSLLPFWKTKASTRPVVRLYRAHRWIGMRSNALAYTVELPPGRESSVLAFIGKYLPLLSSKETSSGTDWSWKIFIFGMGFVALLLIGAILYVLL